MLKMLVAIVAAAILAAAITMVSAPIGDASPLPQQAAETVASCTQRPWPYLSCVDSEFANPRVRLILIERPAR